MGVDADNLVRPLSPETFFLQRLTSAGTSFSFGDIWDAKSFPSAVSAGLFNSNFTK